MAETPKEEIARLTEEMTERRERIRTLQHAIDSESRKDILGKCFVTDLTKKDEEENPLGDDSYFLEYWRAIGMDTPYKDEPERKSVRFLTIKTFVYNGEVYSYEFSTTSCMGHPENSWGSSMKEISVEEFEKVAKEMLSKLNRRFAENDPAEIAEVMAQRD